MKKEKHKIKEQITNTQIVATVGHKKIQAFAESILNADKNEVLTLRFGQLELVLYLK